MGFYDEYFNCSMEECTKYKVKYLKSVIQGDLIYKFIGFDKNTALNLTKLNTLNNHCLWFSYYKFLNDTTEFKIKYNAFKISRKTNRTTAEIEYLYACMRQIYDVCSFSYEYTNHMWSEYANNGFCMVFSVADYDYLWPVEYTPKNRIDFTSLIIKSFHIFDNKDANYGKLVNDAMAIYPFVVKNPLNETMDSRKEKEVRMIYSPYDKKEFNDGILAPNIKDDKGYKGINVLWDTQKIVLKQIIVNADCMYGSEIKRICDKHNICYMKRE